MTGRRCTCSGPMPGAPSHEWFCGKPERDEKQQSRRVIDLSEPSVWDDPRVSREPERKAS